MNNLNFIIKINIIILTMFSPLLATSQVVPDSIDQALVRLSVIDGPVIAGSSTDKDLLNEYLRASWSSILNNIDKLSDNEKHKIFAVAMDALDDKEYLSFLIASLTLFQNGKIDKISGNFLIMPNDSKEGFLAVNYRDKELAKALTGVRNLFQNEPDYINFIDSILNGQASHEYLKYTKGIGLNPRIAVEKQLISKDIRRITGSEKISPENIPGKPQNLKSKSRSNKVFIEKLMFFLIIGFGVFAFSIFGFRRFSLKVRK